ncbi:MAG TPA: divalent metal cation transporter [Acidimicrobiales bacterium]|nr:divalent metal cation transporter [Acidimicrobiales bacterium]
MRARDYVRLAGPGMVTGAADIDPTTVATLAVVGSTTVYGLAWLALLMFPVLAVIQVVSSRVGVVTRSDLQRCVARAYGHRSQWLLLSTVLLGAGVAFTGVQPIRLLFIASIFGGVGTPIGGIPPPRRPQPAPDGRPAHLRLDARGRVGCDRARQRRGRPRARAAAPRLSLAVDGAGCRTGAPPLP